MNLSNIKITEYNNTQKNEFLSSSISLTPDEMIIISSSESKLEANAELCQVSVLIPMYNPGKYIYECIESIAKQGKIKEIIIVNDGSTDDTLKYTLDALDKYAKGFNWKLISSLHRGQAIARNNALSFSSGKWIFYVDADDVLTDCAIQKLLQAGIANPEYSFIYAYCKDFISPDLTKEEASSLQIKDNAYPRNLAGCTLVQKRVYDEIGGYNESLSSSETAEWMLRLKDAMGMGLLIEDITLMRRYHNNNFGRISKKIQLESYRSIIRERMLNIHKEAKNE